MQDSLPKLKGLKGLKKLPKMGRKYRTPDPPKLGEDAQRIAGLVNDELSMLARKLGSRSVAKSVLRLKQQYPHGTYPELVTMWWLNYRQVSYEYQAILFGGRSIRGGMVMDFVVINQGFPSAWRIQGNYWHSRPDRKNLDDSQRTFLENGATYQGSKFQYVVDLFEDQIMTKETRDTVFENALSGIQTGSL